MLIDSHYRKYNATPRFRVWDEAPAPREIACDVCGTRGPVREVRLVDNSVIVACSRDENIGEPI